jgi:hypothetical protein
VKPSQHRPFRDRPGEHNCVGLQDIEVEVLAGPAPIQSYCNQGQWQSLEGVSELMEQAVPCPAQAVLCQYGPMRGILIWGGPLGLSLAGSGVPVIWTQKPEELPETVRKALGVTKFVNDDPEGTQAS